MKHIFYCLVLILFISCKKIKSTLSITEWNEKTLKIDQTGECPKETLHNINLFIDNIRENEIQLINDVIGVDNIKWIIEDSFSGFLGSVNLRIVDVNDTIHIFKFEKELKKFYYLYSREYKINNTEMIDYECYKSEKYQYFSLQSKIENGQLSKVYVVYY